MHVLPSLPPTVRPLSDPDSARLRKQFPDLWANPHQSCITCGGKKVFLSPEGETECNCIEQWALHRFLLNAGIGTAYQRLSWADIDAQVPVDVQEAVMDYALNAERYVNAGIGLILHGDHGTGKTLLSTLLVKKMLELGYDGYFTRFAEMLDDYTSGWRSNEEREWFIRRVRNAGVLCTDDVGKEYKGKVDLTGSIFDQVIRARVADAKPLIITTNYKMDDLRKGYGGAVMSLLTESCLDYEVTGTDYRERSRQRMLDEVKAGIVRPLVLS
jgi:DNA replication protein DnaC